MFLFTDAHVANESFLELINNMLTSGMIPALYDDGEKEGLISGIREEVHSTQPMTHLTPACLACANHTSFLLAILAHEEVCAAAAACFVNPIG